MSRAEPAPVNAPEPAAAVPRWEIRPAPTDEELVALMTVLQVALRAAAATAAPVAPSPGPSRWARAGRLAATVPWLPVAPAGGPRGWRRG